MKDGQCPSCEAPQDAGLLCHTCTTKLERDLGDVAAIVDELNTTISRQARIGQGGKGGGLASEKTPVHLGAIEVADNLGNVLTMWARDIMDGGFGPTHPAPITGAAAVLMFHIDQVRKHPAVDELVDEITDAIGQARRVVDRPADRMFVGPCLVEFEGVTCHEDLYAKPRAAWVVCKVCGSSHDVAERRDWMLNDASDRLFTVREAAQILGSYGNLRITESTIRGYISGGKLGYHGKVEGSSVIRLGDLLAVIGDHATRKSGRKLRPAV
jgi:transcription elongation factor Elf1